MHIFIKNKFLIYDNYKVKCALGKEGDRNKEKEGDLITPKGSFKLKYIFYRKDKIKSLKTRLKKIAINNKMGWCDDPTSKYYNKLIRFPFMKSAEKLYRSDNVYDIILVLDYNMNPIKLNRGSAIFVHIAKKGFSPTKGCVAISKRELKKLVGKVNKQTRVIID